MRNNNPGRRQVMVLAFALTLVLLGIGPATSADTVVPGQAIVRMHGGGYIQAIAQEIGALVADSISELSAYLIVFAEELPVDSIVIDIEEDPGVAYAHGNRSMELPETSQMSQGFPDQKNPLFIKGESPLSFYEQPGIYSTGIDSANAITTGLGQVVAVIDNGIVYDHPLIAVTETAYEHDFIEPDGDASEAPGPLYGHGTFVTSMVLLAAPDATIMPLRAFDENGIGDQFAVAQAVSWASSHGASVINLSCGTESAAGVLEDAIADAVQDGVVLVASSGNEGSSTGTYPAVDPVVIAVTSFDTLEILAAFANFGDYLDVCAPGVNLYGALPGDCEWGTWSGTSFSAPLVSGTVALIRGVNPMMMPADIQGHLRLSARTELIWGTVSPPDPEYGYGALDAYNAVASLTVGDLNSSGTRNQEDLELLQEYVLEWARPGHANGVRHRCCDVNCDGAVDVDDIVCMIEHLVGNLPFQPCFR